MPITDLTGTKWLLNSELSYENDDPNFPTAQIFGQTYAYDSTAWYDEESRDTFEINSNGVNAGHLNFTSNNENFVGLVSLEYSGLVDPNYIEVYRSGEWTNEAYRTIEITGGTDATNTDLINWLQENATQIIEPTITDLTGYTWVGNETIDISNSFTYSLNFISNSNTFASIKTQSGFGTELLYDSLSVYSDSAGMWNIPAYQTIQITGGTDATNSTLIQWLLDNGTLTAPQPQPTDTNKISVGTLKLAKAFIGNSEVASMWLGNVKIYEKASSYDYNYSDGTLTIDNAPYNYDNGVLSIE